MHLKSISTTPSLISLAVTPGPAPAVCVVTPGVVLPLVAPLGVEVLLLLEHAAPTARTQRRAHEDNPPTATHARELYARSSELASERER